MKTKRHHLWHTIACGLILGSTRAFASTGDPLPDAGLSVLRVMGALALVLALFFGGVWIVKNRRRIPGLRRHAPRLDVLEARSLGNRHSLCLITCEQQRFLLAVSPNGVTLLSRLPPGKGEDRPPTTSASSQNFGAVLQGFLAKKT